jgi:NitT/TauT family transport system substrate-binding protein
MNTKRRFLQSMAAVSAASWLPAARSQQLEEVNYLLPAPPFLASFIPWVLAQSRGYFAKEGLKVNYQVAKGGVDVAVQVGAGNAPIGGAIGDTPIIARAQGIPVKAVAVIGGGALTQLVVHEGGGIRGPQDLRGKTVTVLAYQDTTYYSLLGMLGSVGINKSEVDIQAAGPTGMWQLFAAGKAQAMAAPADFAVSARDAGAKIQIFPSDNYFKSMAQAILASDAMIQKRPDLIGKLVRATTRALSDIIKEGKGVVPDYIKGAPNFKGKEAFIADVVQLYLQYTYRGQKVVGAMDPQRLDAVQKFYVSQGIVPKATPLNELYTNQFLQG